MQYAFLGRSGMRVSRLCLGTMNFGPRVEEKDAHALMDRALELGINFFDTADAYGPTHLNPALYNGYCEEIIGRWFALGGNRREHTVLTTKCGMKMPSNTTDGPNDELGYSAYRIRKHVDASLSRLQTDHIDVHMMHHIDYRTGWDEVWETYGALIAQGKVTYAASSNFGARHLCWAQQAAEERGMYGLVAEEHKYHLLCREPELEVLPACQEMGIGVVTYHPLWEGMWSGHMLETTSGGQRGYAMRQKIKPEHLEKLERYAKLCDEIGESMPTVTYAWLLSNPAVTSIIIGPRTMEQLESSVRATEITLDDEVLAKIDEIYPGMGGSAPKAYAW